MCENAKELYLFVLLCLASLPIGLLILVLFYTQNRLTFMGFGDYLSFLFVRYMNKCKYLRYVSQIATWFTDYDYEVLLLETPITIISR